MVEEIPLSQPDITDAEIRLVSQVLRSGRLSQGPMIEAFETAIAALTGRSNAVACSSGTAGLHMAMVALGIGPGDEVVTTPFSFIASANAILYVGAAPVFVDIDPGSLNMDPAAVERAITPRTKAILAVEAFGNPTHMDRYRSIADKHEIKLVEDCCEGIGGRYKDRPVGSFGHVGVFGFYPNKQITTGEGGALVTDDDRLADIFRSLRNQGRAVGPRTGETGGVFGGSAGGGGGGAGGVQVGGSVGGWLAHERLGFNYRMSEVQAAIGVVQMRRLSEMIEQRQRVARRYIERLLASTDLIVPTVDQHTFMSWFVFVVRLTDRYGAEERDRIIEGMRRHDVGAANYFPCIHLQPFYRAKFGFEPGMLPIAESVCQRTIALPFYNRLTDRDAEFAAQTLEHMIAREGIHRA